MVTAVLMCTSLDNLTLSSIYGIYGKNRSLALLLKGVFSVGASGNPDHAGV